MGTHKWTCRGLCRGGRLDGNILCHVRFGEQDLLSLDGDWVYTLVYTGREGGLGCFGRERFFGLFVFLLLLLFTLDVEKELRASHTLSTCSAKYITLATKESLLTDTDQKCTTTGSQTWVSAVTDLKFSVEDAPIWLSFRLLACLPDALPSSLS